MLMLVPSQALPNAARRTLHQLSASLHIEVSAHGVHVAVDLAVEDGIVVEVQDPLDLLVSLLVALVDEELQVL